MSGQVRRAPEMIEPDVDGEIAHSEKRIFLVKPENRVAIAILSGLTLVARAIYELEHTIRCGQAD